MPSDIAGNQLLERAAVAHDQVAARLLGNPLPPQAESWRLTRSRDTPSIDARSAWETRKQC